MNNLSKVPIPVMLAKRPKASNGYVIPFVQLILSNGEPDFRIHDLRLVRKCVRENRCALCGEIMQGRIWFAGGPKCLEHRKFVDPPAHKVCLQYAFQICPFLACPTSIYSQRSFNELPEGEMLNIKKVSAQRPETIYAFQTTNYQAEFFQQDGITKEIVLTAEAFTKVIEDKDFIT